MAEQKKARTESKRSDELFFTGLAKRPVSPLNDRVWKYLLSVVAGCLLAWVLVRVIPPRPGFLKPLILAAVSLAAWGLAVRLLFIETRARLFWIIWLVVGVVPLASSRHSVQGWIGASVFSFVFLLVRKYRPYGHLGSRRQTALFGIGLVVLAMLLFFWPPRRPAAA
ncbi:MAG: hypothetical protein MUP19_10350, partial [Candidatus Aminicenantes bacterium]|nr:hypothetical protein [Candidatus Aminicenantes bacterium]